jgi:hypothetical protein
MLDVEMTGPYDRRNDGSAGSSDKLVNAFGIDVAFGKS